MGVADVKKFFEAKKLNHDIILLNESSATVMLAAKALGVEEERIAKTLAFNVKERSIVIVASGTAKIDNQKFKAAFSAKAKMMSHEETFEKIGHPVGGVCPFGLPENVEVYIDKTITHFDTIYPAGGAVNAIVKMTPKELIEAVDGKCIDVCKVTA